MDENEMDRFVKQAIQNRKAAVLEMERAPAVAQVHALLYLGDMLAAVMAATAVVPSSDPDPKGMGTERVGPRWSTGP